MSIEKFISEHKSEFDNEIPELKIWAAIDKELDQKSNARPVRRLWTPLRIAASIIILIGIGVYAGSFLNQNDSFEGYTSEKMEEFVEVENYYRAQYSKRVSNLSGYQVDPTFQSDIQEFDEVIEELKEALKEAPKGAEEQIIGSIIQNYQTRIDILERIYSKIKKDAPTNNKKERDEVNI